jgi:radical SAM superfamily enzyme YgiQ (UPF0313 family)
MEHCPTNAQASKVLLINTNRCQTPDQVFPLGLAYLNAALRQAGHQVDWLDCLADADHFEAAISGCQADYIGISLRNIDDVQIRKQEMFWDGLAELTARIRRHTHAPIILGGSGFSLFPQQLLQLTGADFGICGAGEIGMVSLIAALQQGGHYQDIPSLVYRQEGEIIVNPVAPSRPAQALIQADRPARIASHYLQSSGTLNLQTQRGCGFRCCYCTYPVIEGKQHIRRPPEMVADEFEQLQRLGARYVFITDSIFNSSPRHVAEISEALRKRNLKMSWGCFLRPQGLTRELMRLMAQAGLSHIEFGSDSFCDEVLSAYGKDFSFDDIQNSSDLAQQENIEACHFLISGGPGESDDTLTVSFKNSQHIKSPVILAVVGMRIYPGTPLFELAVAEERIPRDAGLLTPAYYLAPGLTEEKVFNRLQEQARLSPGWIIGDANAAYRVLVERFRQRGVTGPLWSYFAMMQRLWPQGIGGNIKAGT